MKTIRVALVTLVLLSTGCQAFISKALPACWEILLRSIPSTVEPNVRRALLGADETTINVCPKEFPHAR